VIAARFHNGLADAAVAACRRVRAATGLEVVALSGGVFQNVLLAERVRTGLLGGGFRVLTHSRVPANDGGISLGRPPWPADETLRACSDRPSQLAGQVCPLPRKGRLSPILKMTGATLLRTIWMWTLRSTPRTVLS